LPRVRRTRYVLDMQNPPSASAKPWLPFRLLYVFLALQFAIPAASYLLVPSLALDQFEQVGRVLGEGAYPLRSGELGLLWRVLAAGNVMTLALMCGLIAWDLRKYYIVLVPLVFLKGFSAVAYFSVYFVALPYRGFLAIFALDGVTAAAMVIFAREAHRRLPAVPTADR
jgi:hypothetical protein